MGIHDGHRDRLRESFLKHGLESFNDINALELLLFYAIPRINTNELAHRLLDQFGSLESVFEATEQELCEVPGIGKNTAALIMLVPQIVKKSRISSSERQTKINSVADAARYLIPFFLNEKNEKALLLCLDTQRQVICCIELGKGVADRVDVSVRQILEEAIRHKASQVILAHNHPDGKMEPSSADNFMTEKIIKALRGVNIRLADHLIICGERYLSYERSGALHVLNMA